MQGLLGMQWTATLSSRVAAPCLDEAAGEAGFSLCVEEVEAVLSLAGSQGHDCSPALVLPASVP